MTLPARKNLVRITCALMSAVLIPLAMPATARASNGDDWHRRDAHLHHQGSGWGGPWLVPPPFGMRVYPGYYPAPIYSTPCTPYYAPPPPSVPLPPVVLSFGFRWH
jgi:hypothetical protein